MKILIDRSYSRFKKIENKDFYLIIAAAENYEPAIKRTIEEFREFLFFLFQVKEKNYKWDKDLVKGFFSKIKALDVAYNCGKIA